MPRIMIKDDDLDWTQNIAPQRFEAAVECTDPDLRDMKQHCGHLCKSGIWRCCACGTAMEPLVQAMLEATKDDRDATSV